MHEHIHSLWHISVGAHNYDSREICIVQYIVGLITGQPSYWLLPSYSRLYIYELLDASYT